MVEKRKNPFPWMVIGGGLLLLLAALTYVLLNRPTAPVMTPTPTPSIGSTGAAGVAGRCKGSI